MQVPPGVDRGARLRVRGEGDAGRRGGEPGDLYVVLSVKDHPEMRREGMNIHSDTEVRRCLCVRGLQGGRKAGWRPVSLTRHRGLCVHTQVSFADAILGSQVKVETVDGPVELKVPPGTQPGTTLLMSKRGAPRLGNAAQRGDHLVSGNSLVTGGESACVQGRRAR